LQVGDAQMVNEEYAKKLVVERLKTIPPNVSFSIGSYGDFTRDELISEVLQGTEVGKETIESELKLLQGMPKLISKLRE